MEGYSNDAITSGTENQIRELNLKQEDRSDLEVPENGRGGNDKITKGAEPYKLGGSLSEEFVPSHEDEHCDKPGAPTQIIDHVTDPGIDCTREPDSNVVESDALPETPQPNQIHNDKYWDERSLDREISDLSDEEKDLRENRKDFERAARENDDSGRTFQNDVLDPYYRSGSGAAEDSPDRGLDSSL